MCVLFLLGEASLFLFIVLFYGFSSFCLSFVFSVLLGFMVFLLICVVRFCS